MCRLMHRFGVGLAALALLLAAHGAHAHGDEDHSHDAPSAAPASVPPGNAPQRLSDGSLFVPKSAQRQLGIRTLPARFGEQAAVIELSGKVVAHPNASGRIQATQAGSVLPGPDGMPLPGSKVAKGEVLAWLRPIGGAIERGNQQAQLADLDARLAIAESRVLRFAQLEGAISRKEREAARIEHAALQKQRAFVSASINSAEPLTAPVAGVISASHMVAGQVVDAKELLFEIIDPTRLAVEALTYDAGLAPRIAGASAQVNGTALELKFLGGGRQLREQALPLLFQITTPNPVVAVGQPLNVLARSTHTIQGVALPRQALSHTAGNEAAVWLHIGAERFVARKVRVQPLNARDVTVSNGLHEGERVVVEGASLLSQVR
jgi:hypothetical protein